MKLLFHFLDKKVFELLIENIIQFCINKINERSI